MQIREVVEDLHKFREFRPRKERVIMLHVLTYPNRLGGKRGAGVPGYGVRGPGMWKTRGLVENTGRGKHGVWWKTRGLMENTGSKCKTQGNYFA